MYTLKGELKTIKDKVNITDSFSKREFVVTDNSGQYPQHIIFELIQDSCGVIDSYKVGDMIEVYFNIRGREWVSPSKEVKYFNTFNAWEITEMSNSSMVKADAKNVVFDVEVYEDNPFPF